MTPEKMAALHAACFTVPRPWSEAEFASLLTRESVIVVTDSDGFAIANVAGPEAELLTIAVATGARRKGGATTLMARLITAAAGRGAIEMFLEVAADNAAAIALYTRTGFAEVGRRGRYYATQDGAMDAIVMRRPL